MFYDLRGDGVKIQVMADAKNATEYDFEKCHASTCREISSASAATPGNQEGRAVHLPVPHGGADAGVCTCSLVSPASRIRRPGTARGTSTSS